MRIHLITAESPESRRLRGWRLIQFPQLTMPLIAALTPREHDVHHTDEIVERIDLDRPADLVGITSPTPSADAVVVGEAEDTWPRMLEDAAAGRLERFYRSTHRASLDGQAAPRWDLIKGRRYGKSVTFATRRCPHRCDYCTIPLLYGPGTMRYRPVEEVVREVAGSPDPHS